MATIVELVNEINRGVRKCTDKNNSGFGAVYDEIFLPYKDTANKVLELGVNLGGSVWVWDKYFTKAEIHGVDIQKRYRSLGFDRFSFHACDLGNKDDLAKTSKAVGPCDIIIDDASHSWSHQIAAFETFFPLVERQGLYIVEDVETSYNENRKEDVPCPTFVEYVKNLIDSVIWDLSGKNTYGIEYITFRHNMIIMRKK